MFGSNDKNKLMIKKYVLVQVILIAVLCYFAWQFSHTVKMPYTNTDNQLDNLYRVNTNLWCAIWLVGMASLVIVHVAIHKTREFLLLLIPYVMFTVFMYFYFDNFDDIFRFRKMNGFWKGEFSMSGIFAIVQVIPVLICYGINYAILKYAYKQRPPQEY